MCECGAKIGKPHKQGCDGARCGVCGQQLLMCGHWPDGNTTNSGVMMQEYAVIAEALGLFIDERGQPCDRKAAEMYDLNKASVIYVKSLRAVREREGAKVYKKPGWLPEL